MTPARIQGGLMPTFNQFVEDFFNNDLSEWRRSNFSSTNTTVPKVNVKEDDDTFTIEMAAPGMKKDDFGEKIEAKYEDGVLKLAIPKKEEAKPKPPKSIDIS